MRSKRHPARGSLQGAVLVASQGPGIGGRGTRTTMPAPTQVVEVGSAPLSSKGGCTPCRGTEPLVEAAGLEPASIPDDPFAICVTCRASRTAGSRPSASASIRSCLSRPRGASAAGARLDHARDMMGLRFAPTLDATVGRRRSSGTAAPALGAPERPSSVPAASPMPCLLDGFVDDDGHELGEAEQMITSDALGIWSGRQASARMRRSPSPVTRRTR